MLSKVMVVDDDPLILEEIGALLNDEEIDVMTASTGTDALRKFDTDRDISVIITDLRMPDYDGLVLLDMMRNIADIEKRIVQFVVISGNSDQKDTIHALKKGVSDYLTKPAAPRQIVNATRSALQRVTKSRAEEKKQESNRMKIQNLEKKLDDVNEEIVGKLSIAAELKDPETGNHINRIGSYAELMSRLLGHSKEMQTIMYLAAPLHDIGKIGTPEAILQKTSGLTTEEMRIMQDHTRHGHRILSKSKSKTFHVAAEIALAHHERWDGTGYPLGLKGDQIPLSARITTLVDVYDALRARRPYKREYSHEEAMTVLIKGDDRTKPEYFDPHLLDLFQKNHEEFKKIFELLKD